MHPAYSVILFTTASGAGYGLLIWIALLGVLGLAPTGRGFAFLGFALSLSLISAGLLSSSFHLGRPERAWRAFSQWRTSWLSREGVLAVATFVPSGLLALIWIVAEQLGGVGILMGLTTVLLSLLTVYCTGMIYASLRTIRQWNLSIVPIIYIALALASGVVLFNLLAQLFDFSAAWCSWLAILVLSVALALKAIYWLNIDSQRRLYTMGDATGLRDGGKIRVLEPAHSEPNFVMREMGYQVARKHAQMLRLYVFVLAFTVPIVGSLAAALSEGGIGLFATFIATVSMAIGLTIERWLFFAEAEHVVMLYYGAEAA